MNRREFATFAGILIVAPRSWWPTRAQARPTFNVRDFGAVGDGHQDDTNALERALAAAATRRGIVTLPAGTFVITRQLNLRSGVAMVGVGPQTAIRHSGANSVVLACVDAEDAEVAKLALTGTFSFGVVVQRSRRVAVRDCTIQGGTVRWSPTAFCGGVFAAQADQVTIENNIFTENGLIAPQVLSSDIQINGFGSRVSSAQIRIVNNQCLSHSTQTCIAAYDVHSSEISGNICAGARTGHNNNNGYGVMIYQTAQSPGSCFDNTVSDNTISNTEGTGIYLQQSNRSRVSRNDIQQVANIQDDASLPVGGVALNQSRSVVISDNCITESGRTGISITSNRPGVGDVEVTRNTVERVAGIGVHLRGYLNGIRVRNNLVSDVQIGIGSLTQHAQSELQLSDNVISASPTARGIVLKNATRVRINRNAINGPSVPIDFQVTDPDTDVSGNFFNRD